MTNEDSGIRSEARTTGEILWELRQCDPELAERTLDPLVAPLRELAGRCDDEYWRTLAFSLLDVVPVSNRQPALVLRLALDAPAVARPELLAEYWHLLIAGIRHDPLYVLAVALDVWGDTLSSPPGLLAATLAAAPSRVKPESPWRIRERPRDVRGSTAAVLDALAAIPAPFDFLRGWGLVRLKPLLAQAGALDQALEMARGLSARFDTREDTLRRLRESAEPIAAAPPRGEPEVRKETVLGDFGSHVRRVHVYVGRSAPGFDQLHFQAAWLREVRGGQLRHPSLGRDPHSGPRG